MFERAPDGPRSQRFVPYRILNLHRLPYLIAEKCLRSLRAGSPPTKLFAAFLAVRIVQQVTKERPPSYRNHRLRYVRRHFAKPRSGPPARTIASVTCVNSIARQSTRAL